jgi:hypothetical protein
VQQSEQLPCQHARQEEVLVGEEGYCWERAKVQSEASDRLCIFMKSTKGQDFGDNGRDHMITESDIWHKWGNEGHRRLNRVVGSSYMRWRNHVIQETQRRITAVKGVLRLMTGALTCRHHGLVVSIFERWQDRYAQCSGAVAWALGLVLESWGPYFVKTTAMGTTTVCQLRSRRCVRILQGDISVQFSRAEELEVTVHRLELQKDVLQGNLMAGERKGQMLPGVRDECYRANEEL